MNKQLEYFDVLANTQKQAFNNLLDAQKSMRAQWQDAISKSNAAFTSIPGLPENAQTKEALNQFNNWFSTVATSSQTATEEALKAQENWISAYDKQLAVSRDVLKNFIEVANPGK
jgi:chaperone required for assembly of F1-ATPase